MRVRAIRTRLFIEGEDLVQFIGSHVKKLPERSVLVVTSKIVALAEGRTAPLSAKTRVIKAESTWAKRTRYVWLTVKDGTLMANAGVDASNAKGKLILLPRDSFMAAQTLRAALKKRYGVKKLGILITDSRTAPLRSGVVGVALGYAGISGLRDYRGTKDLFGRTFEFSSSNVADALSAAAVVVMGEGKERCPLAVIEDAPVVFVEKVNRKELAIDPLDDMYKPFFVGAKGKKR